MKSWFNWFLPAAGRPDSASQTISDPLDAPLLYFSEDPRDVWTIRSATQSTCIWGSSGSGKSTGSGRFLAEAFLRSGAGGIVFAVKRDEPENWRRYCAATGRLDDLLLFEPAGPWRFNPILYEFTRPEGGIVENVVELISSLAEVVDRRGSRPAADFWSRALRQLIRNATTLAVIARNRPTLDLIYQIISSAPATPEEVRCADWQKSSVCFACIREGEAREKNELQRADWPQVVRFWLSEFPNLSPRTRSCVVTMFTSLCEPFSLGEMRRLFGSGINVDPEVTFDGKVLVISIPIKQYGELGALAGVLWKSLWQQAVERRNTNRSFRPTFCWMDEAQHFVSKSDPLFLTTSRSALVMCVLLTQNLPNFYTALSRDETHSLLGNCSTQIWHRNSCTITNNAAAETIARSRQLRWNAGTSMTDVSEGEQRTSRSIGSSDTVDLQILPGEFQHLRSGGPGNQFQVDGIVFENGRIWAANGLPYLRVTFDQQHHG